MNGRARIAVLLLTVCGLVRVSESAFAEGTEKRFAFEGKSVEQWVAVIKAEDDEEKQLPIAQKIRRAAQLLVRDQPRPIKQIKVFREGLADAGGWPLKWEETADKTSIHPYSDAGAELVGALAILSIDESCFDLMMHCIAGNARKESIYACYDALALMNCKKSDDYFRYQLTKHRELYPEFKRMIEAYGKSDLADPDFLYKASKHSRLDSEKGRKVALALATLAEKLDAERKESE